MLYVAARKPIFVAKRLETEIQTVDAGDVESASGVVGGRDWREIWRVVGGRDVVDERKRET